MTLLNHREMKIPDSALEGIRRLRERGDLIVIASGRDMDDSFSREYQEIVKPDAVVHTNGQKVTVDGKIIRELFMERETIRELVEFGEEKGFSIGFNVRGIGVFTHPEHVVKREKEMFGSCDREFRPADTLCEEKLYSLVLMGADSEDTVKWAHEVERRFPDIKCALFSGNVGADVLERKASKSEGIRCLLEYFGMDFSQVVAFGDSMNDIEMVRDAGIGVAMGNAIEPLKEVADFVTKDIGEDGVLYALERMELI